MQLLNSVHELKKLFFKRLGSKLGILPYFQISFFPQNN